MLPVIALFRKIRFVLLIVCLFVLWDGCVSGETDEKKKEEDPKKKELKELMKRIDEWYKKSQDRMGYTPPQLTDGDWFIFERQGRRWLTSQTLCSRSLSLVMTRYILKRTGT